MPPIAREAKPGEAELERRVQQLEKEVRDLRLAVDELRKKPLRDPGDPLRSK